MRRDCCGSAGLERGALRLGDANRHRLHLLDLALDQELLDGVFMADSHQRTLRQPLGDGALGCDRGAEQGGGRKGKRAGGEELVSTHVLLISQPARRRRLSWRDCSRTNLKRWLLPPQPGLS